MSSFAERQAALAEQLLGDFSRGPQSYAHSINQCFSPFDLPLGEHEQHYADIKCCAPVSNSGHDDVNLGACNVTDGWWQQCGFEFGLGFESWPKPVPERSNCHNFSIPAQVIIHSVDEDYTDAQLSLPVWQNQPGLSEVCSKESYLKRPRSGSMYALDEIMKKIPCRGPALGPRSVARMSHDSINVPPSPITIPPTSPQVSSDVRLSSPPPFSVKLQSYREPSNMSLVPQSIAARQRRITIREKIRSLEKLIPQDSKLDTSRKLEEAIKYIKFLKTQVQVLECMPQGDSKSDRKLHILLTSPTIQRKLFSAEKVIVPVQQQDVLSVSTDF